MKYQYNYSKTLITSGCLLYASIIAGCIWLAGLMFQYSLYTFFKKDIAWYYDIFFGLLLNGLNLPLFAIALLLRLLGYEIPVID